MANKHRGIKSKKDDFGERQRWKWEFLRRNEKYREDFEKYGKGLQKAWEEYDNRVKAAEEGNYPPPKFLSFQPPYELIYHEMRGKWGLKLLESLRNPDDPSIESPDLKVYRPSVYAQFSIDWFGERRAVLEDRGNRHNRGGHKRDRSPDWVIREEKKKDIEPLTEKNCPHYLIITAWVAPWIQKSSLIDEINQKVKESLEKLLEAQKRVYKQRPIRPRFDEFEKYMKVYDLRQGEKKKSWRKISLEILPDSVDMDSAIRKVRYYHDQAVWWINEGWKML